MINSNYPTIIKFIGYLKVDFHGILKTDNILHDEDFHPHITDFGLSKIIELGHSRSQTKFLGTLAYEAPEFLR